MATHTAVAGHDEHTEHAHTALAHHFDNLEQQREAGALGMWVFIAQEVMFFGGLFLVYVVYRLLYPAAFAEGSAHLDRPLEACLEESLTAAESPTPRQPPASALGPAPRGERAVAAVRAAQQGFWKV